MNNLDIRMAIKQSRFKHYEIAKQLGISETYFCKKLHYELLQEEKNKIFEVIKKLKEMEE